MNPKSEYYIAKYMKKEQIIKHTAIMNKEKFFSALERTRRCFLTILQLALCLLISPAFLVVLFIIWIDQIKDN